MANTKIQRWAILLTEYGATIKYRPGNNNIRADMLSRLPPESVGVIDASQYYTDPPSGGLLTLLTTSCHSSWMVWTARLCHRPRRLDSRTCGVKLELKIVDISSIKTFCIVYIWTPSTNSPEYPRIYPTNLLYLQGNSKGDI